MVQRTHYYSYPNMPTQGEIVENGQVHHVTGTSWMDHQFGSNMFDKDQIGYNWYCLQLSNNTQLMLYLMHKSDGTIDPSSSGTMVMADGTSKHLLSSDYKITSTGHWKSDTTGANYETGWNIEIPSEGVVLSMDPVVNNQELDTRRSIGMAYWEGDCSISGKVDGKPVRGEGYVEQTGYEKPINALPLMLQP